MMAACATAHYNPRCGGVMRITSLLALLLVALATGLLHGQITANPIPAPIEKRSLVVGIRDILRLPDTRALHPEDDVNPAGWARVSYVRDLPDGRRFANDSRGVLYLLAANTNAPSVYLDMGTTFPRTVYNRLE